MSYLWYCYRYIVAMYVLLLLLVTSWPHGTKAATNCHYSQQMELDTVYYIYPPSFPDPFQPGTSCKWIAQAPADSKISLNCYYLNLPVSINCEKSHLSISQTEKEDLTIANVYCGTGSFSTCSDTNFMNVALFSDPTSEPGKFDCTMLAYKESANNEDKSDENTEMIETESETTTNKPQQEYQETEMTPNEGGYSSTPPQENQLEIEKKCNCGTKKKKRIFGGTETGMNEYPMMAALVESKTKELFCGATIISERYLLTAAQCVSKKSSQQMLVLVGDHDITRAYITDDPDAKLYQVAQVHIHERYKTGKQTNNIAITKTIRNIIFSEKVGPACLPFKYLTQSFLNISLTAVGWGGRSDTEQISNVLNKATLKVVSDPSCDVYPGTQEQSLMCTYNIGRGVCKIDSGGPVCYEDRARRVYLVGIIGHNLPYCSAGIANTNIRITEYLRWIETHTTDAFYCNI